MSLPTTTYSWALLQQHAERLRDCRIDEMISADSGRADRLTIKQGTVTLDYSRQLIDPPGIGLLIGLFQDMDVRSKIQAMASGQIVNPTEGKPALHMALRGSLSPDLTAAGVRISEQVEADRELICSFADKVVNGDITADSGRRFGTVVHIGIGGSCLGPQLVLDALADFALSPLEVRFLYNVDPSHFERTLAGLDLEECLFVVASRSMRTEETLANATAVADLLHQHGLRIAAHMAALTNDAGLAADLGIELVFPVRDWLPGRFGLWGSLALTVCLGLGSEVFRTLCAGAHEIDDHFLSQPPEANIPVIMALLSVWNVNFLKAGTHAVLPYTERLRHLVTYVQQLEMESNGKRVSSSGEILGFDTAPVIWGAAGTTPQHTFYQLLHQGTRLIPSDIILTMHAADDPHSLHPRLVANGTAQARALTTGTGPGTDSHKYTPGNQPLSTITLGSLTPHSLGALLACYEHKTVVQGFLWGINSFDQWGVLLGKRLAQEIYEKLA